MALLMVILGTVPSQLFKKRTIEHPPPIEHGEKDDLLKFLDDMADMG